MLEAETPEIVMNGQVPHLSGVQEDVGMEMVGTTILGGLTITAGMMLAMSPDMVTAEAVVTPVERTTNFAREIVTNGFCRKRAGTLLSKIPIIRGLAESLFRSSFFLFLSRNLIHLFLFHFLGFGVLLFFEAALLLLTLLLCLCITDDFTLSLFKCLVCFSTLLFLR